MEFYPGGEKYTKRKDREYDYPTEQQNKRGRGGTRSFGPQSSGNWNDQSNESGYNQRSNHGGGEFSGSNSYRGRGSSRSRGQDGTGGRGSRRGRGFSRNEDSRSFSSTQGNEYDGYQDGLQYNTENSKSFGANAGRDSQYSETSHFDNRYSDRNEGNSYEQSGYRARGSERSGGRTRGSERGGRGRGSERGGRRYEGSERGGGRGRGSERGGRRYEGSERGGGRGRGSERGGRRYEGSERVENYNISSEWGGSRDQVTDSAMFSERSSDRNQPVNSDWFAETDAFGEDANSGSRGRDSNSGGFRGRGSDRGGFRGRDSDRGGFRGRDSDRGGFRGRDSDQGGFTGKSFDSGSRGRGFDRGGARGRGSDRGGARGRGSDRGGARGRGSDRGGARGRGSDRGGARGRGSDRGGFGGRRTLLDENNMEYGHSQSRNAFYEQNTQNHHNTSQFSSQQMQSSQESLLNPDYLTASGYQKPQSIPNTYMNPIPNYNMGSQTNQHMGSMANQQMGSVPNERMGSMPNQYMGSMSNQYMGSMPNQSMGSWPNQHTSSMPMANTGPMPNHMGRNEQIGPPSLNSRLSRGNNQANFSSNLDFENESKKMVALELMKSVLDDNNLVEEIAERILSKKQNAAAMYNDDYTMNNDDQWNEYNEAGSIKQRIRKPVSLQNRLTYSQDAKDSIRSRLGKVDLKPARPKKYYVHNYKRWLNQKFNKEELNEKDIFELLAETIPIKKLQCFCCNQSEFTSYELFWDHFHTSIHKQINRNYVLLNSAFLSVFKKSHISRLRRSGAFKKNAENESKEKCWDCGFFSDMKLREHLKTMGHLICNQDSLNQPLLMPRVDELLEPEKSVEIKFSFIKKMKPYRPHHYLFGPEYMTTGFTIKCGVCHISLEESNMEEHCMTQEHYDNYKKFLEKPKKEVKVEQVNTNVMDLEQENETNEEGENIIEEDEENDIPGQVDEIDMMDEIDKEEIQNVENLINNDDEYDDDDYLENQ